MVVTYYIKLYHTEDDRHNGILMSLLALVAETITKYSPAFLISPKYVNFLNVKLVQVLLSCALIFIYFLEIS